MPSDGARSGGNRGGRGDWRGGGRTARPRPGAPAAKADKGHDWARKKQDDSEKLIWIFRAKIAFGVLLTVGLFALIVWMLPRPTTTPFISLVVTDYEYPLPPNAWAYDDVENIRRVLANDGPDRNGGETLTTNADRQIAWKADKSEWINNLKRRVEEAANVRWYETLGRGPGKGAIIVYLSGLGVVDDNGRACLLMPGKPDAEAVFDPEQRIPMRDIFHELFYDRDAERERLPRDVLKFVVLDAGRADQSWELGLPYNAFVEGLRDTVQNDLPVSNLFVLNAADSGQMAWPSPELGGTVFGHFVRRGLQGHADGYAAGSTVRDRDRFVTVAELFEYVRRQTTQFVADYRGDEQRPVLIKAGNTSDDALDRQLVEYGESLLKVEDPADEKVVAARTERLAQISAKWAEIRKAGWDEYAKLAENGIRRHPLAWQRFQHMLLRLERLAVAGSAEAYQVQYTKDLGKIPELIETLKRTNAPAAAPNSIALTRSLLGNVDAATAAAMDAAAKALDTGNNTIEGAPLAAYPLRAETAWRWVEGKSRSWPNEKAKIDPKLLDDIDRIQASILPTDKPWSIDAEPVEVHFVRMLAAHRNHVEPLSPQLAAAAIEVRNKAELAGAPADVRVHYHVLPQSNAGDEKRRQADDLLFLGLAKNAEQNDKDYLAASASYDKSIDLARELAKAYSVRDRALANIPWLLRYHARRLGPDASLVDENAAITDLVNLHQAIKNWIPNFIAKRDATGIYDAAAFKAFSEETVKLAKEFDRLNDKVVNTLKERYGNNTARDRLRALDALSLPLLQGESRKELHDQVRQLFAVDFKYEELAPDSEETVTVAAGRADRHIERMDNWPINPALALVGPPFPEAKSGQKASLAELGKVFRQRLIALEQNINAAGDKPGDLSLPTGFIPPVTRSEIANVDLESRAVGLYRGKLPKVPPAERLERFDLQRLAIWQFQRTLDDFWGPSPTRVDIASGKDKSFFDVAAHRFEAIARQQNDGLNVPPPDGKFLNDAITKRSIAARNGLSPTFAEAAQRIQVNPKDASPRPVTHAVTIERAAEADLPVGKAAYYLAEAPDRDEKAATLDPTLEAISGQQVDTDASRLTFDVAAANSSKLLPYTIKDPGSISRRDMDYLRGLVLYRGHRFRHPSETVELVPYIIDREFEYKPPEYGPPVVTIAAVRKPRAVLFVLDCSGSMVNDKGKAVDRMKNAKIAATAAIKELKSSGGDTMAGLWMYGHRSRYKSATPGPDAPIDFIGDGIPVRPPADVEERVKLAMLTDRVQKDITEAIGNANGFGYTPLYLAIHEALTTGFSTLKNPELYDRQIVVLTDGENWQYKVDPKLTPEEIARFVINDSKLAAALDQDRANSEKAKISPVRLDVVGYDFSESAPYKEQGWDKGNRKELVDILEPPGAERRGQLYDITTKPGEETTDKLSELLQTLFGVYRFTIVDTRTNAPARATINGKPAGDVLRFNQHVVLLDHSGRYNVSFEGGNVDDAKPEDFEFTVRNRGEHLLLRTYDNVRLGKIVRWLQQEETDRERVDYRAGDQGFDGKSFQDTHGNRIEIYPRKPVFDPKTDGMKFFVATKYPDGKRNHTKQPLEAIAMVQPVIPGTATQDRPPVTIFDVTFEPNQSVPMMSFVVPKWREKASGAKQALVWIWFKFDSQTEPFQEFAADATTIAPVTLDGLGTIKYSVNHDEIRGENENVFRVEVKETHVNEGSGRPATMDRVKVSMEFPPSRIRRTYIAGGKEIVHTFEFPADGNLTKQKLARYKVFLTRVEDMKKDAVSNDPNNKNSTPTARNAMLLDTE